MSPRLKTPKIIIFKNLRMILKLRIWRVRERCLMVKKFSQFKVLKMKIKLQIYLWH